MNYRQIIKNNKKKTKIVLAIYMFLYLLIGFIADIALYTGEFRGSFVDQLLALMTFKLFPMVTIIMLIIGFLSIIFSIKYYSSILLEGDEYIEVDRKNRKYRKLYNIVEELKIAAGMRYMPKIFVIEAEYLNAFASGWNQDNTMVAVTTGLMDKLSRDELSAVMAHEMTHIRNEDVKLTLIIGVTTNIMLFVVNNLVYLFGGRNKNAQIARLILLIFQLILPLITILLQMYLSRTREYMADSGAIELTRDNIAMANALKKISYDYKKNFNHKETDTNKARKVAYIYVKGDGWLSTHPNVKNRIDKCLGRRA